MKKGDWFITAILAGIFATGFGLGFAARDMRMKATPAVSESIDPRIPQDIAELDRRTKQLADNETKMQKEILQLHMDDESIVAFVENAFQSFFGGGGQAPGPSGAQLRRYK